MEPIKSSSIDIIKSTFDPNSDDNENATYDSDYEFSRDNIKNTLLKAEEILDEISELARQSQAPRAYEVAGAIVKSIFDGNKDLLELAKRHKELRNSKIKDTSDITNNNVFIGSTEALGAFLESHGIGTGLRTIETEANKDV